MEHRLTIMFRSALNKSLCTALQDPYIVVRKRKLDSIDWNLLCKPATMSIPIKPMFSAKLVAKFGLGRCYPLHRRPFEFAVTIGCFHPKPFKVTYYIWGLNIRSPSFPFITAKRLSPFVFLWLEKILIAGNAIGQTKLFIITRKGEWNLTLS